MKRSCQIVIFLILVVVSKPAIGQNLLQNPSFESLTSWDDLWILSTIAPSSVTAVFTEVTTDAHEGSKSVELSNTVGNKWTYLYSDSVNAPLSFSANKRYEIKGWVKSIEEAKGVMLSVFWNGALNELILYDLNPDPITNPDWFMVLDTIIPVADYSDGYLRLGLRAAKDGSLALGKLLLDDFSVIRLPDTETDIVAFSFPEQTGPANIDALLHTVIIEVPFGADLTSLYPTIVISDSATIVPDSSVDNDFSIPVVYTVTAEDGITNQDWTITVTKGPPSKEIDILSFTMAEQTAPATIDNVLHTIILEVAFGTDLSSLIPILELSSGATINPPNGSATNFSTPVIFKVTAEDGITTQDYIVALMLSTISNETNIVSFAIPEQIGLSVIDNLNHTVTIEVPYGTDVTTMVPTIGLSAGATVVPDSGVAADFPTPLIFTVTADDGISTQDWTVTVVVLPNTETDIVAFSMVEQTGLSAIDTDLHSVTIEVPYGIYVTTLVPTIGLSAGATVVPDRGVAADFTAPVIYTVTAEDGISTQDWTVTVVVLINTETDIVAFSMVEQKGPSVIDADLHSVTIEVPYGTDVTTLVPTIVVSEGASIVPDSGVAADFTAPVIYTVTAEDGISTQDWTITVVVLPNAETDIVAFSMVEQTGPSAIDTDLHSVAIEVDKATDLTSLIPTIVVSEGASINPVSGVAMDFTTIDNYTVTAEDGVTSQDWSITVTLDPALFVVTNQAASTIYIYPNPATNTVNIKLPGNGVINLYDVLGRVVVAIDDASILTTIPVADFEKGIYFIHARWENISTVSKIILE